MLSLTPGSRGRVQSSQTRGSREPPTPGTPSPAWPCLPLGADKAPFATLPVPSPGSAWSGPAGQLGSLFADRVALGPRVGRSHWGKKLLPLLCPPQAAGLGLPSMVRGWLSDGSGAGSCWEQGGRC